MPISADIYGQFAPRPVNPQDVTNGLMDQARMGMQMQDAQFGMQQKRDAIAQNNALQQAVRESGGDPVKLRQALVARGNHDALDKHDKTQAQIAKDKAATDKDSIETRFKRLDLASRDWMALDPHDDQAFATVIAKQVKSEDMSPDEAKAYADKLTQMTPDQRAREYYTQGLKSLDMKDRLSNETQRRGQDMTAATATRGQDVTAQTSRANNADTNATAQRGQNISAETQRRGQNMVDARSRDANAASLSKPFEVTGEDGTSRVLVQQDKQGNLKPVTGYSPKGVGGPLKLTEVQANATSFVSRMRDSTGTIQQIEDNVGRIDTEAAKSTWTNWLSSPKAQMYQQARRNWVTANLRKESGAAIPESELENEYKKWFPTIGDSKENIALKRQARQVAEEAMTVQAGPGAAQVGGILERGGSPAFKAPDGWKIEKVQ
jgi:hypothetical protein